jgi:hypothetical protein
VAVAIPVPIAVTVAVTVAVAIALAVPVAVALVVAAGARALTAALTLAAAVTVAMALSAALALVPVRRLVLLPVVAVKGRRRWRRLFERRRGRRGCRRGRWRWRGWGWRRRGRRGRRWWRRRRRRRTGRVARGGAGAGARRRLHGCVAGRCGRERGGESDPLGSTVRALRVRSMAGGMGERLGTDVRHLGAGSASGKTRYRSLCTLAYDEARQLDRRNSRRAEGDCDDHDCEDSAHDLPCDCRCTLAWYRPYQPEPKSWGPHEFQGQTRRVFPACLAPSSGGRSVGAAHDRPAQRDPTR